MILHRCEESETITDIARRYGVSPVKILEDNGILPHQHLIPGEVLLIFPGAVYHTVRGGETPEQIADNAGISLRRLFRQNPSLAGEPFFHPGQILNVDSSPLPHATLCGRITAAGRESLRAVLPYLDAVVLDGGRLRGKRIELPRHQFLPDRLKKCVSVNVTCEDLAETARFLWEQLRESGYTGVFPQGEQAKGLAKELCDLRKEAEWVISDSDCPDADVCFCPCSEERRIQPLTFGAELIENDLKRLLTEKEKNAVLRRYHFPIHKEGAFSVVTCDNKFHGTNGTWQMRFSDAETRKTGFEKSYESGVRIFYLEELSDFTVQNRLLFAGCFD